MNKCPGCGAILQSEDVNKAGYIKNLDYKLCERCFKIKNYNYYDQNRVISNEDILLKSNDIHGLRIFLCDLFTLNDNIVKLYSKINNPKIFLITKIDVVPKNINLDKLKNNIINYIKDVNVFLISIKNDYGKNELLNIIRKYNSVCLLGPSSSGKSSLINHLFSSSLTVSNYQNTTQDFIEIKNDGIKIYDVPGFTDNYRENINYKKMIKPITMNLKKEYELVINDYVIGFKEDASITLFFESDINIKTNKKKTKFIYERSIQKGDILINNLGFIYIKKENVLCYSNSKIFIRPSLVGEV